MSRKVLILLLVGFSVGGGMVEYSFGQTYPSRAIEIYVGWAPGSYTDLTSRLIAEKAARILHQSVVVVNKPGASGTLAASEVIAAKPDGYKLSYNSNIWFATATKTMKIPFDPYTLMPLVNFTQYKGFLAVRGDSPWKSPKDVLEYAKKKPGDKKLIWVHPGRGTNVHLSMSLWFKKAGIDSKTETVEMGIPGSAEILTQLLGGHADVAGAGWSTIKDHFKLGRVKALAAVSEERYKDPSDVPSAVELGYPELVALPLYFGLYIHKNTSQEIVKTLSGTFKKIWEDPEVAKFIDQNVGENPVFEGPEFMRAAIKKCEENGVPLLKELGLFVQQ